MHKGADSLRLERDQLSLELEAALATISQFEHQEEERKKATENLEYHETEGLSAVDEAVQMRDSIIADLSSKLEKTLDVLQRE